jgi:hypothetical protein
MPCATAGDLSGRLKAKQGIANGQDETGFNDSGSEKQQDSLKIHEKFSKRYQCFHRHKSGVPVGSWFVDAAGNFCEINWIPVLQLFGGGCEFRFGAFFCL